MLSRMLLAVVLGLGSVISAEAQTRTWSAGNGKISLKAAFVRQADGKVTLRKEDGSEVEVAIDKLSAADRDFLGTLSKPAAKTPTAPWTIANPRADSFGDKLSIDGKTYRAGMIVLTAKAGERFVILTFDITANEADPEAVKKLVTDREGGAMFKIDDAAQKRLSRGVFRMFDSDEVSITTIGDRQTVKPAWAIEPNASAMYVVGHSVRMSFGDVKAPWLEAANLNGRLTALVAVKKKTTMSLLVALNEKDYFIDRVAIAGGQAVEIDRSKK